MNIGIIIHTQTGHTLHFAKAIQNKLIEQGHTAEVKGLRTKGAVKPRSSKFELRRIPKTDEYEAILFGGPVWAFTASPVIIKFLKTIGTLKGKKALCFVTMGLPLPFLGGKQAVKAMESELDLSGGDILPGVILPYFFKGNRGKMNAAVQRVSDSLK